MKNQTNDGIFCDYCGDEVKGDFVYYSFDFEKVSIHHNTFTHIDDAEHFTADICEKCMELFRQRLLQIVNKIPEKPTRCDVTGTDFGKLDESFYKCKISKVMVNMSDQTYYCSSCNKSVNLSDGPCPECKENLEVIREAKIDIDDKYLNLNFCSDIFAKFKAHIKYIKNLGDAEWVK